MAAATAVGVWSLPAGAAVAGHYPAGRAGAAAAPPGGHHVGPAAKAPGRAGEPRPLTRGSRTVRHANGTYTTTIFPGPVNYRTASGWQPIDSSVVAAGETGFAWRNKANRYTASFARHAGSGYLRLRVAGQAYDFDAAGRAVRPGRWPGRTCRMRVPTGRRI